MRVEVDFLRDGLSQQFENIKLSASLYKFFAFPGAFACHWVRRTPGGKSTVTASSSDSVPITALSFRMDQMKHVGGIVPEHSFHIGIGKPQIPASQFQSAKRFKAHECGPAIGICGFKPGVRFR